MPRSCAVKVQKMIYISPQYICEKKKISKFVDYFYPNNFKPHASRVYDSQISYRLDVLFDLVRNITWKCFIRFQSFIQRYTFYAAE